MGLAGVLYSNSAQPPLAAAITRPFMYLPQGWDATWVAAKLAQSTTPAWIAYWTDSIGQGAYADNWLTHGYPGLITAALKARYPVEYAEYWPVSDSTFVAAVFAGTPPWVVNDTAHATNGTFGLGGTGSVFWAGDTHPTAGGPLATFTTPIACTAIDLHWLQHYVAAGATWTYTVDGGAPQTVTTPAPADAQRKVTITGLSKTIHTVVITGQSVDYSMTLMGASCYPNGTSGVGIGYARVCMVGLAASSSVTTSQLPSGQTYQWFGGVNYSVPSPFGFPTAPHLTIIELGVNDCPVRTVGQFAFGMRKTIEAIRLGRPNASILIVVASQPDPLSTDIVINTTFPAFYLPYVEAMYAIASSMHCGLIDVNAYMGSTPVASGYMRTDGGAPHPTTVGHAAMASLIIPQL